MAHIDDQLGILQNPSVPPFEPVIPPADGMIAPLDFRAGFCFVRKSVIPRAENCFHRRFGRLAQHVGDTVAISIDEAADQKAGHRDFAVRAHRTSPERSVVLMLEIEQ